jgi:hypothetical protein
MSFRAYKKCQFAVMPRKGSATVVDLIDVTPFGTTQQFLYCYCRID